MKQNKNNRSCFDIAVRFPDIISVEISMTRFTDKMDIDPFHLSSQQ